ncbi:MAG: hypothetical protein OS112_04845 [Methanoregula sp.]|nr:MAG: hypothetical protein OS112_04845 [Methanoregula sp.]
MGLFDFSLKSPTKKQRRRQTIRNNQRKGKAAEDQAMMRDNMMGYETERTGRGHDYRRRKRNPFTGRVTKSEVVEVKSGNAKLSPLQKKTKKKKSNYRVVRENPPFY